MVLGALWIGIFVGTLALIFTLLPAGMINLALVIGWVPTFLPFPRGLWFLGCALLLVAIMVGFNAFRDLVDICFPDLGIIEPGFPFLPAIALGFALTWIFGDVLIGVLYPALTSCWWFV
jgi:hypothetical protein